MMFLILFTLGVVFIYWIFISRKKPVIPHGLKEVPLEKGLPIIGTIYKIKPNMHSYFVELGKKHGSLFRIKLGMRDALVLNNFEVLKKTFKEDGENFSGRYKLNFMRHITRNSGIFSTDKDLWSEQRSFVMKVLRDFGVGKSISIEIVQNECSYMLEELETLTGKQFDFTHFIPAYTSNIISKFIMNKRYPKGNHQLKLIETLLEKTVKSKDYVNLFFTMFPFFDNSNFLCKLILTITSTWKMFDDAHEMFQKEIDEHLEKLDMNSEGEDLIDRFLIEQHRIKEKTGNVKTFTNWQLIRNAFELFIAGYETTSITLGWAFTFMSRFPDIQKKVYEEIIEEIGKERMPTMSDKKSLNYTQAVMDEIMRMSCVAPIILMHRNLWDANVNGFFIPKNSSIFGNLYACLYDPEIWENPMEFNPNRFLSADHNGKLKYSPREELIPFGIGKRICLGESLAKMEYFIFFTSIMQKFNVSFSEKLTEGKYQEILKGNNGILRYSLKTDFIFKRQ